ncbi:transcriptional regulator [Pseudomonas sp. G11-1]|uniref:SoxR reducing system RseC family protein n=1 Tax=Halopseudomonas sp. SMJS2 TaxID=3041098 RepID=UPI000446D856|nr:SoxR reducing system RseC family protein [Halopseudomonas sp. SMJS2]EZQ18804.1 alginate regulatory protein [Halopseudomonas bauzanensis]MCO5787148.1 transcriptional regulator [Pseudomonas sp. G11-1]MCO5790374.1 transcriptional regulator [Pseudomonas sp. G11-2]WGK62368.1 SoxR reducing system RseC family protein [Halopseudomonas sp. SMJS2]
MIEEQARVLSVEQGAVWVETIRRSACSSCQARAGCGQSLLQRLGGARRGLIRALDDRACRVGEEVVIGIPENAMLRGSSLIYMVPLLGLFSFALLAQVFGAGEPSIILAGFSGLGLGFVAMRWYAGRLDADPDFTPQVVSRVGKLDVVSGTQERSNY